MFNWLVVGSLFYSKRREVVVEMYNFKLDNRRCFRSLR